MKNRHFKHQKSDNTIFKTIYFHFQHCIKCIIIPQNSNIVWQNQRSLRHRHIFQTVIKALIDAAKSVILENEDMAQLPFRTKVCWSPYKNLLQNLRLEGRARLGTGVVSP